MILYVLLSKIKNTIKNVACFGLFFMIVGIVLAYYNISLFFDLSVIPIAIFYLAVGYIVKVVMREHLTANWLVMGCISLIGGLVVLALSKENLILKSNDVLPVSKIIFSVMENIGIMFVLYSVFPPHTEINKLYKCFGIHWQEHNGNLCLSYAGILLLPNTFKSIVQ
ncbi:hypothetical protein [Xylanibacter caecicola]|uniref:hypothetical protein n=1 Tax=Xylanibacter caecicola TaxID=2736294 RepID=UPI002591BFBF|nr:hypothetical protein [Xylanibacter caecicola]